MAETPFNHRSSLQPFGRLFPSYRAKALKNVPISKDKKKEIFDKVASAANEAKSLVFVKFGNLPVSEISAMRKTLREAGISYYVAKKTIAKKALDAKGFTGSMPELPGEIALAWSEDLTAPAREIYAFQKKTDKKVSIVGGIFDGAFKDQAEMLSIALIPSLQVLRGQFVNVINSPIQGLVIALKAIADKQQA